MMKVSAEFKQRAEEIHTEKEKKQKLSNSRFHKLKILMLRVNMDMLFVDRNAQTK